MHRPDRVWYLAYGSNVNEQRFLRYIQGDDDHAGARDGTHPAESRWLQLPFELTFERRSRRWGAGVAFIHPSTAHTTWFRAWDITSEQFEDVFAQENRAPVGSRLDWAAILGGTVDVGAGWYRRILARQVPDLAPAPAVTFTAAERQSANAPAAEYAETITAGLSENPYLTRAETATYVRTRIQS